MTRCGSRVGQDAVMHNTGFFNNVVGCDPGLEGEHMRRRGFIMLLGGRPGGHETGQREAKTKVPPNAE
jgi:hypothetical protein